MPLSLKCGEGSAAIVSMFDSFFSGTEAIVGYILVITDIDDSKHTSEGKWHGTQIDLNKIG